MTEKPSRCIWCPTRKGYNKRCRKSRTASTAHVRRKYVRNAHWMGPMTDSRRELPISLIGSRPFRETRLVGYISQGLRLSPPATTKKSKNIEVQNLERLAQAERSLIVTARRNRERMANSLHLRLINGTYETGQFGFVHRLNVIQINHRFPFETLIDSHQHLAGYAVDCRSDRRDHDGTKQTDDFLTSHDQYPPS